MLVAERRSRIRDIMERQSTVSIAELAGLFGTSEMTIRRDLDNLAARGVCLRTYGGAITLRAPASQSSGRASESVYPTFQERECAQVREKLAIARAAASLVRAGDVVAIDSGTTAACLAREFRAASPITVITNSIRIIAQLQDSAQITLVCPGGIMSSADRNILGGDLAFVGPIAVSTLRTLHAKKAFITTSGLTVAKGISNASLFQAEIKRILIEIADEAILLADHTKFGQSHGFLVAPPTAFSRIITDTMAPPEDVAALRTMGIDVIEVTPTEEDCVLHPAPPVAAVPVPDRGKQRQRRLPEATLKYGREEVT
jgi:DeoR/GlpR family transcriptional regulator of sugar metabolism